MSKKGSKGKKKEAQKEAPKETTDAPKEVAKEQQEPEKVEATQKEETAAETQAESEVKKEEVPHPLGEHKLQTPWSFYFDKKLPKPADFKNYATNLQKFGKFDTLEGFWKHYAYVKAPDEIPKGHNLFMFRHELTPAWETFPKGGTWIIKMHKKNGVISRLWEELLFACVGELFEEPDIVGVMLSTRNRADLLSVWNGDNSKNPEVRFNIGEKLRDILNLDESTQVEYKHFKTAMRDGSSFRNAKPYVYAAQAYGGDSAAATPAGSARNSVAQ